MPKPINRYDNTVIANHIASQYVLGLLSPQVKRRVEKIVYNNPYGLLRTTIAYWEEKMFPLHANSAELPPKPATWKQIEASIDRTNHEQDIRSPSRWHPLSAIQLKFQWPWIVAATFFIFSFIGGYWQSNSTKAVPLSYVAVLSSDQQPNLVATTYGESRELAVEVLALTPLEQAFDYELWVVSKTDKIARSLGVLDATQTLLKWTLTEAEWRLIKDSDSLLLTIEESGGSPFGEPSNDIVSKGLCIRLPSGNESV